VDISQNILLKSRETRESTQSATTTHPLGYKGHGKEKPKHTSSGYSEGKHPGKVVETQWKKIYINEVDLDITDRAFHFAIEFTMTATDDNPGNWCDPIVITVPLDDFEIRTYKGKY